MPVQLAEEILAIHVSRVAAAAGCCLLGPFALVDKSLTIELVVLDADFKKLQFSDRCQASSIPGLCSGTKVHYT